MLDLGQFETVQWLFALAFVLIALHFLDDPLADGFDIMLGNYTVKVPNVTPGSYQILGKRPVLPVFLRTSINLFFIFYF